jgi:hypothetical protein
VRNRETLMRFGLPLATLIWALVFGLLGESNVLLHLAPALLLVVPLAFGRYVGEEFLEELRERSGRRAVRPATVPAKRRGRIVAAPRVGRLIAFALAQRPPPHPALA